MASSDAEEKAVKALGIISSRIEPEGGRVYE